MTDEERAILAAIPDEPITARTIAKRVWGDERTKAMGQRLRHLALAGYVESIPGSKGRAALWYKLREPAAAPTRTLTYSASVPVASPSNSSGDRMYASVSLPMPKDAGLREALTGAAQ